MGKVRAYISKQMADGKGVEGRKARSDRVIDRIVGGEVGRYRGLSKVHGCH